MNKFYKVISGVLTFLLLITLFMPVANAQDGESIGGYSEKEVTKMIDFIKNEAIEVGEKGSAQINLQKVEEYFGYVPQEYEEFNDANKNINECSNHSTVFSTFSVQPSPYNQCITDEIRGQWADITGVASLTAAAEALAAGAEWKAAKHVLNAGVKGGIHGTVLSLGWIQIKCIGS